MNASDLALALRASRGLMHKQDLQQVLAVLGRCARDGGTADAVRGIGDDCAVIADGDGHLLLAIEGLMEEFVMRMPWFAGYCSIMVNVSDIHAMGGRPLAVVDALWSQGMDPAAELLDGMATAARRYGVPIVGGHSNNRSNRGQLAVAILGRARRLLSSFGARPGDELVMAVDLRGRYQEPYAYWNASTEAPADRLRADLELLPQMAESGLCDAAKDISMAGALGTLLMMLECSKVGATVDVDRLPRPAPAAEGAKVAESAESATDAGLLRWLTAFPSFGFILSTRPQCTASVLQRFHERGLAAAEIGVVTAGRQVDLRHRGETARLWDFGFEALMASPAAAEGLSLA